MIDLPEDQADIEAKQLQLVSLDGEHHITFRYRKIPFMRAVPILEVLRSGVMRGTSLPQLEKDPKGYITSLVLALTPIAFEKLGAALMEFVDWRTAEDKDWIPATGNENDAFRNLEGVDVYRIVVQGGRGG